MTKLLAFVLSATVLAFGVSSGANASLLGQEIECQATLNPCDPTSATVGPGPEFELAGDDIPFFSIDVGDSSIVMALLIPSLGTEDGFEVMLSDLVWSNDPSAEITGITNFTTLNVVGVVEGDITTFSDAVTIDYSNSSWGEGGFVSFDLVTTHDQQIPEPSALFLFAFGLALTFWWTRRARPAAQHRTAAG